MKIFALIPVHNRLAYTKGIIHSLRSQTMVGVIRIVVIDDGSTDGTAEYLAGQDDVAALGGDGKLWWAGSIEMGLHHILPEAGRSDYVLFLNNDTSFAPDYVETLIAVSRQRGGAAVGSVIVEEADPTTLTGIGPGLDLRRQTTWDLLWKLPEAEKANPREIYEVDALSGRGTLYRAEWFKTYGTMVPRLLPHYYADYEIAMRFHRDGRVPLVVSTRARVISPPVYGTDEAATMSGWQRIFGMRSASNVIHKTLFFMLVGSPVDRLAAPFRVAIRSLKFMVFSFARHLKHG